VHAAFDDAGVDPRTVLPGYRKNSNKVPVVAVVERGGHVRIKVVPQVTQNNVGHFPFENIENSQRQPSKPRPHNFKPMSDRNWP
jgi:hypothetical protein